MDIVVAEQADGFGQLQPCLQVAQLGLQQVAAGDENLL